MHGNTQFMFRIGPGKRLTSLQLKSLGRLLRHDRILCDYLSIFINHAILYVIFTRHMPSPNFQYSCFLESVLTAVNKIASDAATFDKNLKFNLADFVCIYNVAPMPTPIKEVSQIKRKQTIALHRQKPSAKD